MYISSICLTNLFYKVIKKFLTIFKCYFKGFCQNDDDGPMDDVGGEENGEF